MLTQELLPNESRQMGQEPTQGEQPSFVETGSVTPPENREPGRLARFGDRMLQLVDRVAAFSLMPADASGYPSDYRPVHEEPHEISPNWYKG